MEGNNKEPLRKQQRKEQNQHRCIPNGEAEQGGKSSLSHHRPHHNNNQTTLVSSSSSSPNGNISPTSLHPTYQQQQRRRRPFHGKRPFAQPTTRIPYNGSSCNPDRFPPRSPIYLEDDDLEPRQYGRERFFQPPPSPRTHLPPITSSETYLYARTILLVLAAAVTVTAAFRANWLAVFLGLGFVLEDIYGLLRDVLDWYVCVVLEEVVDKRGWE